MYKIYLSDAAEFNKKFVGELGECDKIIMEFYNKRVDFIMSENEIILSRNVCKTIH